MNNQKEFLPPINCFSCGKILINSIFEINFSKISKEEWKNICEKHNIKRICCKRMYISFLN